MAGRFMKKEVLISEAKRLNVNLEGLTWPQQQSAVLDAIDAEAMGKQYSQDSMDAMMAMIKDDPRPGKEVIVHVNVEDEDFMDKVRGKKLIICPEMAQTSIQLFGIEEELGDDLTVSEVLYDIENTGLKHNDDLATSTFKITGKTGKKVIAQTGMPKEGCEISFRPDKDWFPVCTFQGKSGYLWTHHRLPNVKHVLMSSGFYEDYRSRFQDEPYIWHSGGKLLACDINLVHSVMREIERKTAELKIAQAQRTEFINNQIG